MYDLTTEFDCNYALEIFMRSLKSEWAVRDLTAVSGPPKQRCRNFATSLFTDADVNEVSTPW